MDEKLTMVTHDLGFAISHLQEALHKGKAVDSIILLDLIEQAANLQNKVARLHLSWLEDNKA
jgi:hypothetical protein